MVPNWKAWEENILILGPAVYEHLVGGVEQPDGIFTCEQRFLLHRVEQHFPSTVLYGIS